MDVKFRQPEESEKPDSQGDEPPVEKPSLEPEEEAALERLAKLIKRKLIEAKLSKNPEFQKRQKAIAAYKKNGAA